MTNNGPFGHRLILYSETGHILVIRGNGEISGTQDDGDPDSHIEICSGGEVGQVKLYGLNSNLYVCYASNGEIYGERNPSGGGTIFKEEFQGSYSAFKSSLYPEWYIGIKKNGLPKKGYRTKYGQKAIKFLPRRL